MVGCCCCCRPRRPSTDEPERLWSDDRFSDKTDSQPFLVNDDPLTWPTTDTDPMYDTERNAARSELIRRNIDGFQQLLPPIWLIVCAYAADAAFLRYRWNYRRYANKPNFYAWTTPHMTGRLYLPSMQERMVIVETDSKRWRPLLEFGQIEYRRRFRKMIDDWTGRVAAGSNGRRLLDFVDAESVVIQQAVLSAKSDYRRLFVDRPKSVVVGLKPYDPPMHPNQRRLLDFVR